MSLAKILLSNSAPQSIVLLIAKPFIEVFGSLFDWPCVRIYIIKTCELL